MCAVALNLHAEDVRWAVYYDDDASYEDFRSFKLVVFDRDVHPSIQPFIAAEKITLGYLSIGEVADYHHYFQEIKDEGILTVENPNWPGSWMVDLRDPRWASRVIEELVPSVLFKRFTGIFLDTIDDAEYEESLDPAKYKGMKDAAVKLVKGIRLNYPHIPIMLNRGLEIAPQVVQDINMLLVESTYSRYNHTTKKYEKVPKAEYEAYHQKVKVLQELNPSLEIYTLDYWDPADTKTVKEIYQFQRAQGYYPYVATIDLQKLMVEP